MPASRFACAALLSLAACATRPSPPATQASLRLIDLYRPDAVEATASAPAPPPQRTEWRFDRPAAPDVPAALAATHGFAAGPGIAGLKVEGGRLAGRTTSATSILHLERASGLDNPDLLDSIEVRMTVSAGTNLTLGFNDAEKVDLAKIAADPMDWNWPARSPIVAGKEARTYVLKSLFPVAGTDIRHLRIRPSDAAGASFAIEHVRLIFRKEQLASVPSGIGWQALSHVYREALVARSPETARFELTLPAHPWLDVALGTIEDRPVTFRVSLRRRQDRGRAGTGTDTVLLERTVTTAHRWESAPVDLAAFAGEEVSLALTLAAENEGALGMWGAPVVRERVSPSAAPQGVIVIWADTLRKDHLGVHGYRRDTSPALGRLAAEGTLFLDCLSQATWTKVSTPSLFTSLYPTSHGVHDFADRLPAAATTLAEVFRSAGYATVSYSSILFTGKFTNLHQGFEELHEDASLSDRRSSKTAREYVDRLLVWLEGHRDSPFFAFLHISDPHDPYRPRPPYDALWADPGKRAEHERQAEEVRKVIAEPLLKAFGMPTRDELARAGLDPEAYVGVDRDWYDGSIRGMDAEIGRLVERLRALGLERRTLLVFTSDHGEEFLEHGRTFHGQGVYAELNQVPLMLWAPGLVPAGRTLGETVAIVDVMPTILELARLEAPAGIQGRSLVPWLAATPPPAWEPRPVVTEKAVTSDLGGPPPRDTELLAIAFEGWKLIHNKKRPDGHPEYELYDRRADPLDQKDLAGERPEVVARLTAKLAEWQAGAAAARLGSDAGGAAAVSAEDLERLRSLGYVQ